MEHSAEVDKKTVAKPVQSLIIDTMSEKDINSYCIMFQHIFAQPPWNETWTVAKISISIKKVMRKKGFLGSVAKSGSQALGYSTGYRLLIAPAVFYLDQLFVDDRYQGQGVGKALFSNTHHLVKSHGYRGIILLTKPGSPADRFYVRNGFKRLFSMVRFKGKVLLYLSILK